MHQLQQDGVSMKSFDASFGRCACHAGRMQRQAHKQIGDQRIVPVLMSAESSTMSVRAAHRLLAKSIHALDYWRMPGKIRGRQLCTRTTSNGVAGRESTAR